MRTRTAVCTPRVLSAFCRLVDNSRLSGDVAEHVSQSFLFHIKRAGRYVRATRTRNIYFAQIKLRHLLIANRDRSRRRE